MWSDLLEHVKLLSIQSNLTQPALFGNTLVNCMFLSRWKMNISRNNIYSKQSWEITTFKDFRNKLSIHFERLASFYGILLE